MTGKPDWGLVTAGGRIVAVYSLAPGRPLKTAGHASGQFNGAERYADWRFGDVSMDPRLGGRGAEATGRDPALGLPPASAEARELKDEDACAATMLLAYAACPSDPVRRQECRQTARNRHTECVMSIR